MTDAAPVPYEPLPEARLRVGDTERFEAATALGEHFATGRLDQAEYDARVQAAYAGRTRADLQALFTDLPEPAPFRPRGPRPGWEAGRAARDRPRRGGPPPGRPARCCWWSLIGAHRAAALPGLPVLPAAWFGWGRRAWAGRARRGSRTTSAWSSQGRRQAEVAGTARTRRW